jgi:hypothetical protein
MSWESEEITYEGTLCFVYFSCYFFRTCQLNQGYGGLDTEIGRNKILVQKFDEEVCFLEPVHYGIHETSNFFKMKTFQNTFRK